MSRMAIRIGCAGWALRNENAAAFPPPGSHLQRYAGRFDAVEINSSFYRPHRRATYERWAGSVADHFRFAVKVPKAITHEARLAACEGLLDRFLAEAGGLGDKLGPLLVQLPPSLAFNGAVERDFFAALRARFAGGVVCEPRHATWFGDDAARVMKKFRISRVAADPTPIAKAKTPGNFGDLTYFRLHGAPRMYYSAYDLKRLEAIAAQLKGAARAGREAWCIFDNTAAGAALDNALAMRALCAGA
jgi:uncharacterized protein YecE (DUF72 family)